MCQTSPSDRELIRRAKEGSATAFERLVLRYEGPLYQFLLGRLGRRTDAEDALQETFAGAYRYLDSYRERYAPSTWLYSIAIREAGRVYRRGRPFVPLSVAPEPAVEEQAAETGIWNVARDCLSATAFHALWLYYHEDWPVAKIATTLRRPSSWVKVNLHRARRKLGRVLNIQDYQ